MNVGKEIKAFEQRIADAQARIKWLDDNRAVLEAIPFRASFYSNQLDFDRLSHAEVIQVIQAIGGVWKKEATTGEPRINYEGQLSGITVRCYAGEPPPNCKIVEFEEEMPAQKVIRRKLVCY